VKKIFSALSVALLFSLLPTFVSHSAADTTVTLDGDGFPSGVPAPNRGCGPTAGIGTATINGKVLICVVISDQGEVHNEWQYADGTKVPRIGNGQPSALPNDANDEAYSAPKPPAFANYQGLYHNDLEGLTRFTSVLLNFSPSDQYPTSVASCKNLIDSGCLNSGVLHYVAVLPSCDAANPINCFSDLSATKPDGTKVRGIVKGIFNLENPQNYTGDASVGLPTGTEPTLVQFPGITHAGGDLFLVKPQMKGIREVGQTQWHTTDFKVSLFAVKMVDGNFGFNQYSTNPNNYQNGISEAGDVGIGTRQSSGCAAASKTQCAATYALPLDVSFGVSVKLSKNLTGWLHGRVTQPVISLTNEAGGGAILTINAKPIKTPTNAVWVSNERLPAILTAFYGNDHSGSIFSDNGSRDLFAPFSQIALLRNANDRHNQRTLSEYVYWLPLLGEKAQAMPTMWAVETMSQEGDPKSQIASCINKTNNLAGLVTTNAAEYIDGPPAFANNTLDYKVAATHFEKDGTTVFQGTYDLLMSSDVARCIYGFTKAPIKATISVTNDTGGASVASTVINEANGWLTLGAYGFTYSNPTISVKLSQDAPIVVPAPVATKPVPAKPAPQKIITCVSGKTTMRTVLKTCPKGFKQK
jgi:hypothetical protein